MDLLIAAAFVAAWTATGLAVFRGVDSAASSLRRRRVTARSQAHRRRERCSTGVHYRWPY